MGWFDSVGKALGGVGKAVGSQLGFGGGPQPRPVPQQEVALPAADAGWYGQNPVYSPENPPPPMDQSALMPPGVSKDNSNLTPEQQQQAADWWAKVGPQPGDARTTQQQPAWGQLGDVVGGGYGQPGIMQKPAPGSFRDLMEMRRASMTPEQRAMEDAVEQVTKKYNTGGASDMPPHSWSQEANAKWYAQHQGEIDELAKAGLAAGAPQQGQPVGPGQQPPAQGQPPGMQYPQLQPMPFPQDGSFPGMAGGGGWPPQRPPTPTAAPPQVGGSVWDKIAARATPTGPMGPVQGQPSAKRGRPGDVGGGNAVSSMNLAGKTGKLGDVAGSSMRKVAGKLL